MSDEPLWIDESDVAGLLSLEDAIEALARAYRARAAGDAVSMGRAHTSSGGSILHAVGGVIEADEIAGTKTWVYTPGGASPLLILFSLHDGRVLGVVRAFALGQLRTAATSGLGTRLLARPDARTLALLGTGKQAQAQAEAVACTRPIERIRLYGRNPDRRTQLAASLRNALSVEVSQHDDVASTIAGADVVTAITRAADPIVSGAMLDPGMHVNAVGAIVPSRRELDETAVGRCTVVVADSPAQARDDAGELRAAAAAGLMDWDAVRGLDTIVDESTARLRKPSDITLFKALGVGLSDVALGAEILRRVRATGAPHSLPTRALAHH